MKLYFDGSCGPKNPGGYACYAFVVGDIKKNGIACQGDQATNNVAEYNGLIKGLEYLIENNMIDENLEIFGDSKLVISQLNGEWKCKKDHLNVLLKKTTFLLESFKSWEATWIPREENIIADEFSKWDLVVNG